MAHCTRRPRPSCSYVVRFDPVGDDFTCCRRFQASYTWNLPFSCRVRLPLSSYVGVAADPLTLVIRFWKSWLRVCVLALVVTDWKLPAGSRFHVCVLATDVMPVTAPLASLVRVPRCHRVNWPRPSYM